MARQIDLGGGSSGWDLRRMGGRQGAALGDGVCRMLGAMFPTLERKCWLPSCLLPELVHGVAVAVCRRGGWQRTSKETSASSIEKERYGKPYMCD
ncbi:hypothetical protein E2562_015940 [Oryza meyeriana var. granulata]|uniref:Uncharacterized protein n=1 Tax=Oryza meyeriana var. granulata TaxID=110450 RepID=A0A6G1CHP3_9ORYZ|nr:hypothetical protein E2562_015940 [Oryza meyeriana var. granulata]